VGESAIAIIRVSGPAAIEAAAALVRGPTSLQAVESHRLVRATLVDPSTGSRLDEALCAVMRAPRSYTGEDTVEIFCHGSPALARMLVERLVDQGARLAEPGEFTRRAFLNGRLDLAQAEAVALLVGARTERAVTLAARTVSGELSCRLQALRQGLLDVIAGLEVALDFPGDAVGPDQGTIAGDINMLQRSAESLLDAARKGCVAHAGLTVAIVGAPNAGKSSLFNALLGRERAIVTAEAGTTRDVLEGTILVGGVPVRLLDTAGLGAPRDPIDAEGMRRARGAIAESDILLAVVDGSRRGETNDWSFSDESPSTPVIVVLSKSDLGRDPEISSPADAVPASVKIDGGLDALWERLQIEVGRRAGTDAEETTLVASLRQLELLDTLASSLQRAAGALPGQPVEIGLIELRSALGAVSALLGTDVGDSILDTIFARFCVGK
jgi:tRNA modification GTPase